MAEQKESEASGLLGIGLEMGVLNATQVEAVTALQKQLRRSGINLPVGQTLIERKYITPNQLRELRVELHKRDFMAPLKKKSGITDAPKVKKFGQYELLKVLSEKDRSRVFKARDTVLDRVVVLKVLPKALAADNQWYERFRREMLLAGKLNHPNIATTFGAGEVDGNPLMAIEYVEGVSLGDRLEREGNIPERTAWEVAREVAKALAYAASNGVIHRDIKPDNIMYAADGKIKVIDLGLSKSISDTSGLTQEGTTVGTPFYIAPEQARGVKELDPRTDIYSLGCTVFHMLTGSVPFYNEEFTEVMLMHTRAARPDPRSILPEISVASSRLVMRMMAIKVEHRPPSADALIEEIDALLPALKNPEEWIRPVQEVQPSEEAPLPKKSDPKVKAVGTSTKGMSAFKRQPQPRREAPPPPQGVFARFFRWLFG